MRERHTVQKTTNYHGINDAPLLSFIDKYIKENDGATYSGLVKQLLKDFHQKNEVK
jgi:hypothetical protein